MTCENCGQESGDDLECMACQCDKLREANTALKAQLLELQNDNALAMAQIESLKKINKVAQESIMSQEHEIKAADIEGKIAEIIWLRDKIDKKLDRIMNLGNINSCTYLPHG